MPLETFDHPKMILPNYTRTRLWSSEFLYFVINLFEIAKINTVYGTYVCAMNVVHVWWNVFFGCKRFFILLPNRCFYGATCISMSLHIRVGGENSIIYFNSLKHIILYVYFFMPIVKNCFDHLHPISLCILLLFNPKYSFFFGVLII